MEPMQGDICDSFCSSFIAFLQVNLLQAKTLCILDSRQQLLLQLGPCAVFRQEQCVEAGVGCRQLVTVSPGPL
jgi:hypothetical protein